MGRSQQPDAPNRRRAHHHPGAAQPHRRHRRRSRHQRRGQSNRINVTNVRIGVIPTGATRRPFDARLRAVRSRPARSPRHVSYATLGRSGGGNPGWLKSLAPGARSAPRWSASEQNNQDAQHHDERGDEQGIRPAVDFGATQHKWRVGWCAGVGARWSLLVLRRPRRADLPSSPSRPRRRLRRPRGVPSAGSSRRAGAVDQHRRPARGRGR